MSVIQGEDSESDQDLEIIREETDELRSNIEAKEVISSSESSPILNAAKKSLPLQGTVVLGEDTESESEEDASTQPPVNTTVKKDSPKLQRSPKLSAKGSDTGRKQQPAKSSPRKREYVYDSKAHAKLRGNVVGLYQSINLRLRGIYQTTSKNLVGINDNLSQSQAVIEKTNVMIKKNEGDLKRLNSELQTVNQFSRSLVTNLNIPEAILEPAEPVFEIMT